MPNIYTISDQPMSNSLVMAKTAGGKGSVELNNMFGKQTAKPKANQDTIDDLVYFERQEGKQLLADGYKLKDLHPNMQAAVKYGKTYLKAHEG